MIISECVLYLNHLEAVVIIHCSACDNHVTVM